MPLKKISLENKILSGFIFSLFIVIILSYSLYESKMSLKKSTMLMSTDNEMRVKVNGLLALINKLESDRKSYLLSLDKGDSHIYSKQLTEVMIYFKNFRSFILKNNLEVNYIDSLDKNIDIDLAMLKESSALNNNSLSSKINIRNEDDLFAKINTYLNLIDDQYEEKTLESYAVYQENINNNIMHFFILVIIFMLILGIYFLIVFRDVSERKKLLKKLYEGKDELNTILDTIPSLIFVKNLDKKFILLNNSFLNYFNVTKDKILLKDHKELQSRSDLWLADEEDDAVINNKISLKNIEREIKISNEKSRWFNINKAPLYDKNNNVIGIVGVMADITKRIEFENMLRETRKELQELNDQKNMFFSIIAHDLKSPFTSLLGFSDFLIKDFDELSEEEKKDYLNQINSSIKNILELLTNLLEWARIQFNKIDFSLTEFPVSGVIKSVFHSLKVSAENKKIELRKNCREDLKIYADENMIETVIRNLVNNSIKFTGRNGVVEVKVLEKNNETVIEIIDNGVGMKKETAGNLFKLGVRVSEYGTADEKGTGLGLLVCKEFVARHNGKISVESELNKGTVISFTVPKKENLNIS